MCVRASAWMLSVGSVEARGTLNFRKVSRMIFSPTVLLAAGVVAYLVSGKRLRRVTRAYLVAYNRLRTYIRACYIYCQIQDTGRARKV